MSNILEFNCTIWVENVNVEDLLNFKYTSITSAYTSMGAFDNTKHYCPTTEAISSSLVA